MESFIGLILLVKERFKMNNSQQATIKVTLSDDSENVHVHYLESGNEWEFPADDNDRANLKPCESKICECENINNVLVIHYPNRNNQEK